MNVNRELNNALLSLKVSQVPVCGGDLILFIIMSVADYIENTLYTVFSTISALEMLSSISFHISYHFRHFQQEPSVPTKKNGSLLLPAGYDGHCINSLNGISVINSGDYVTFVGYIKKKGALFR